MYVVKWDKASRPRRFTSFDEAQLFAWHVDGRVERETGEETTS